MGAGIYEWTVFVKNGRVGVQLLDELFDYPDLSVISRHLDNECLAKSAAFDFASKSGLPILRGESDDER